MLLSGEIRSLKGDINTMVEKRFKVQAFSSYLFNAYLDLRIKKQKLTKLLPGDVILPADGRHTLWKKPEQDNVERITITGPVYGYDLTHATDDAGKLEVDITRQFGLEKDREKQFEKFHIF